MCRARRDEQLQAGEGYGHRLEPDGFLGEMEVPNGMGLKGTGRRACVGLEARSKLTASTTRESTRKISLLTPKKC